MASADITVYALADPATGQIRYVGVTQKAIDQRLRQHLSSARRGFQTHRDRWVRKLLRAGVIPTITVLQVVSASDRDAAEQKWIAHFGYGPDAQLCNHSAGGGGPLAPDDETRRRMSVAAKRRMESEDIRQRLSVSAKKQWADHVCREKMAAALQAGWTPEAREHQSKVAKSRWQDKTPEQKAAAIARIQSPESVAKRPQNKRGRKLSEVHRARISQAFKQHFQNHPEYLDRAREAIKARWQDDEFKRQQVARMTAFGNTPQEKARRSALAKRIFTTPEARARARELGLARRGSKASLTTRAKLSAVLQGQVGERSRRAILTWAQVDEIRVLSSKGKTNPELGLMFGVSRSTVHSIVTGKTWTQRTEPIAS